MGLSKFRKQFFNFTFYGGHFVTKTSLPFWNQFKIQDFLIPYVTYFKEKNVHLSEEQILKFINTKIEKRQKHHKIKKNAFSKIVLDIFCRSKTTWSIVNLKNHWTLFRNLLISQVIFITDNKIKKIKIKNREIDKPLSKGSAPHACSGQWGKTSENSHLTETLMF